jgi:hypothetical protein
VRVAGLRVPDQRHEQRRADTAHDRARDRAAHDRDGDRERDREHAVDADQLARAEVAADQHHDDLHRHADRHQRDQAPPVQAIGEQVRQHRAILRSPMVTMQSRSRGAR